MLQPHKIRQNFIESLTHLYSPSEATELFWLSLEHVLNRGRMQLKLDSRLQLSEAETQTIHQILLDLEKGRPIQHIVGYSYFLGEKFIVNESVLIPRPETEELVTWIVDDLTDSKQLQEPIEILDIGTGSGCIPITLKKKSPVKTRVHAVDISSDALQVAKENAELHQADIDFLQLDILQAEPYVNELNQKFHIIVSNPPYIGSEEKKGMHQNVVDYEPHQALFVEQDNPLIFYTTIAAYAMKNLHNSGMLYFEINQEYGGELVDYLSANGFKNIILKKDISGNDRMIRASLDT